MAHPSYNEIDLRLTHLERDHDSISLGQAKLEEVALRLELAVTQMKPAVDAVPALNAALIEINLREARREGNNQRLSVWLGFAGAVFGAVMALLAAYVTTRAVQPDPGPPVPVPAWSPAPPR